MKRRNFLKGLMAIPVVVAAPSLVTAKVKQAKVDFEIGSISGVRWVQTNNTGITASSINAYQKQKNAEAKAMMDKMEAAINPPIYEADLAKIMGRSARKSMDNVIMEAMKHGKSVS